MKKMGFVIACVFVLAGCSKEATVMTCIQDKELDAGVKATGKYELTATKDEIFKQNGEVTYSFEDKENYDAFVEIMVEGKEEAGYSVTNIKDDEKMTSQVKESMDFKILSIDKIKELSGDDADFDYVSLKETTKDLEEQGYTCSK